MRDFVMRMNPVIPIYIGGSMEVLVLNSNRYIL